MFSMLFFVWVVSYFLICFINRNWYSFILHHLNPTKKKSNMIELTFLKRNFCSFTGFLPYLLKQNLYKMYQYMSFGKVSACNVFENWSSANAYVKFKHFYADVLVWTPKLCSWNNEKQLIRKKHLLFRSNEIKPSLLINLNILVNLTLNNQNCFDVMSPSVFRPPATFWFSSHKKRCTNC